MLKISSLPPETVDMARINHCLSGKFCFSRLIPDSMLRFFRYWSSFWTSTSLLGGVVHTRKTTYSWERLNILWNWISCSYFSVMYLLDCSGKYLPYRVWSSQ